MTVKELIDELQKLPKDKEILVLELEGLYTKLTLEKIIEGDKFVWIG